MKAKKQNMKNLIDKTEEVMLPVLLKIVVKCTLRYAMVTLHLLAIC